MTTPPGVTPDIEAAVQRVRELSDRMIELTKESGLSWLEAYEKVLESMLRLEEQAAQGTKSDWVNTLATTHADFVRSMSQVYFNSVRDQLKK
jgi:hypothetical protein